MRTIRPCSSCAAPVTLKMTRCPNCNRTNPLGVLARAASTLATVVGGLSISSTLSACYGAPCANTSSTACLRPPAPTCDEVSKQPKVDDTDGDGYCLTYDCNEKDPRVNAEADEFPDDGIDQNCNGADNH